MILASTSRQFAIFWLTVSVLTLLSSNYQSSAFVRVAKISTSSSYRLRTRGSRRGGDGSLMLRSSSTNKDEPQKHTVAVALTAGIRTNKDLTELLTKHPMLSMLDLELDLVQLPVGEARKDNDDDDADLDSIDAACFASPEAVEAWLHLVDVQLGLVGAADEDKRAAGNGNVVAICINTKTARKALETGRWESRHIYYPKGEEDGTILQLWADIAMQAVGDVMERKFWGGGW